MKTKQVERDFKGVWIAKEIWENTELSWMEKLFITEINSLDGKDGCYASNKRFAEFFGLSNGRCSQIINSLIKKKYIGVTYKIKGKQIIKRVLRILNRGIKNTKRGIKNSKQTYLENAQDNNTEKSNTNNNTNKAVVDSLIKLGIKNTKKITDNYSESYINDRIDIAMEKGKTNPAGYFISILDKEITQELVEPM